jgi:hypothetical protein
MSLDKIAARVRPQIEGTKFIRQWRGGRKPEQKERQDETEFANWGPD